MSQQLKLLPLDSGQTGDDVGAALNLLRDALGDEEQRIRGEGSQAMQRGDYDTAKDVIDFAKRLLAFQISDRKPNLLTPA
jgi:hypothetical protein